MNDSEIPRLSPVSPQNSNAWIVPDLYAAYIQMAFVDLTASVYKCIQSIPAFIFKVWLYYMRCPGSPWGCGRNSWSHMCQRLHSFNFPEHLGVLQSSSPQTWGQFGTGFWFICHRDTSDKLLGAVDTVQRPQLSAHHPHKRSLMECC